MSSGDYIHLSEFSGDCAVSHMEIILLERAIWYILGEFHLVIILSSCRVTILSELFSYYLPDECHLVIIFLESVIL